MVISTALNISISREEKGKGGGYWKERLERGRIVGKEKRKSGGRVGDIGPKGGESGGYLFNKYAIQY